MSTRDEMRRELKDLAKLATVIPGGSGAHASDPLSGSRVTIPPLIKSVSPQPISRPPPPLRPTPLLPLPTPPPRMSKRPASVPPPPALPTASILDVAGQGPSSGIRGAGAMAMGALIAAAMVGALALGHVVTSKSSTAVARTTEVPQATAAALSDPAPAANPEAVAALSPAPTPAPPAPNIISAPLQIPTTTAADLPSVPSQPLTITGACPPIAPRPVRPGRRAGMAASPRMSTLSSTPSYTAPTPKPIASKGSSSRGQTSLDDLIRRASAGGT